MWNRKLAMLLIIAALLLIVPAVLGQQALQQNFNDGKIAFQYPSSFSLDEETLTLTNLTGSLSVTFERPSPLFLDSDAETALRKTLRAKGITVDEVMTEEVPYGAGTRTIAWTELEDGAIAMAVEFTDEGVGMAFVDGNMLLQRATVLAMIASYDSAATSCKVWVEGEEDARVRVGPGITRTVTNFLPTGENFVVLGQSTDDDGNVWYSLDHTVASPGKLVDSAFVRASDVNSLGDCSNLPDAEAPSVVPIETTEEAGS